MGHVLLLVRGSMIHFYSNSGEFPSVILYIILSSELQSQVGVNSDFFSCISMQKREVLILNVITPRN